MPATATELIELARDRKLTAEERRVAVLHYMQTDPTRSNYDLAEEFRVSEATIRNDKTAIRERVAEDLRVMDIGLVVVDAFMCLGRQIKDLERSKKTLEDKKKLGTREYESHCKTIVDTQLKFINLQQDLGYLPKNLGQMQVNKFEYATVLSKDDGSMETRHVDYFDEDVKKQLAQQKVNASLISPNKPKPTVVDLEPTQVPKPEEIDGSGSETTD